jgi:hypothetical protein
VNETAKLWKNNVASDLPSGETANAVFVINDDVYVVGTGSNAEGTGARLWKNGNFVTLKDSKDYTATSVFVVERQ